MGTSIFKIINHREADSVKLIERLNYIRNPMATNEGLTFGAFVSLHYPYEEMMLIKQCYLTPTNNTLQGKQFFEYVVSVPENESAVMQEFILCVRAINNFLSSYGGNYQTIGCIHTNTENLHAHIIMNNIDWTNGTRLNLNMNHFYAIRESISNILLAHGFSAINNSSSYS